MSEVLLDLIRQLKSKPKEKVMIEEANVLLSVNAKIRQGFTVGAVVGFGLTWIATRRLIWLHRIGISIGVAPITGAWGVRTTMDSCIDQILALDGSRIQKELVSVIVQKFSDHPKRMQQISKHFYSESVFDDSTSDQLQLRWRYRNFCGENAAYSQSTPDTDNNHSDSDSKQNDLESKQVSMDSSISLMADPFGCFFGHSATGEEGRHPDTSSVRPRGLNRSHKRSHRRRQLRQHDVS